jgi:molybdate transport system ATP-binding protein
MIWNDSALNVAKKNALWMPGGKDAAKTSGARVAAACGGVTGEADWFSVGVATCLFYKVAFLLREHSTMTDEGKPFRSRREPLIELRGVDVALNGRFVLRGLNWSLRPGEHWTVMGANGSGKSTFLRLLHAEIWPAPNSGERIYRLDGAPQTTAVGVQRHIALVSPESQERYLRQEWRLTARDVIHTGFAQTDLLYEKLAREQKAQAEALAQQVGIASLLRRDMQTLSTGELRKVLIARALIGHPKILLLDEVCDGLDAAFRREMLAFIDSIARRGTQIIYTTHRTDEPLQAITHVALFEGGRLLRQERRSVVRGGKPPRSRRKSSPTHGLRKRHCVPAHTTEQPAVPLIEIEEADVFLDRKKVLHHITWKLCRGQHWVVLGGNGVGKTTFLKLVASEIYPAVGGRVERFGLTARNTIWDLRRHIGCVSPLLQTHYREELTAQEVVASGFFSSIGLMDRVTAAQRRRVRELLDRFELGHLAARRMTQLSFGELRKMLTLRALVHRPRLLILDEPFDGLDAISRRDFAAALLRVAQGGTQLIVVTHHLDDLPRCMTHGLFLESGRITAQGQWPGFRRHKKVVALFGGA